MTNMSRRRRISLVDLPSLSEGVFKVKSAIHKKDFVDFDHGASYYIFNTNYDPESGMLSGSRFRRFYRSNFRSGKHTLFAPGNSSRILRIGHECEREMIMTKRRMKTMTGSFLLVFTMLTALFTPSVSAASTLKFRMNTHFKQSEARSMLDYVNSFRTGSEAYYTNSTGGSTYLDNLKPYTYSYALEEIAMQRAAEIAIYWDHYRPDQTLCFTCSSSTGVSSSCENLAAGTGTAYSTYMLLREDGEPYEYQGHRRAMLSSSYTTIGIACVEVGGVHYWVQEFGFGDSVPYTDPLDGYKDVTINADTSFITSMTDLSINVKQDYIVNTVSEVSTEVGAVLKFNSSWPSESPRNVVFDVSWSSTDTSVLKVSSGNARALSVGSASLKATVWNQSLELPVSVVSTTNPSALGLSVSPSSGVTMRLSWNAVSGASAYEIYRCNTETGTYTLLKTTTGTSTSDTGLTAGSRYYYVVAAYRASGNRRNYLSVSNATAAVALASPTVTSAVPTDTGIKVKWSQATGAERYNIYRADSANGTYTYLASITSGTRQYLDTTVKGGKTYYYKVRAYKKFDDIVYYGAWSAAFKATILPDIKVTAEPKSGVTMSISWTSSKGATSYDIYRATSAGGPYKYVKSTTGTSTSDTNLTAGRRYYYMVRACKGSGDSASYSKFSSTAAVTIGTPTMNSATLTGSGVKLSWGKIGVADGYNVYRYNGSTYVYVASVTGGKLTYTDPNGKKGTYYKVRAYKRVDGVVYYSDWSNAKAGK